MTFRACSLLLTLCTSALLLAQEPIGLQINAMSSAERDAITTNLSAAGELQVVFACVPAGLIVFNEATSSGSREALRTKVIAAIAPIIPVQRITGTDITLEAAETACQNARGE